MRVAKWLAFIPMIKNNLQFELRESCRQIVDRKWYSIKSIQYHLRSAIVGALTRSNCKLFLIIGISSCTFSLIAEEKPLRNEELAKISEAMGHLIGKNLQALGLPLDIESLVRGMQEASMGKESPLSEEECMEALTQLQEVSLVKAAETNLKDANAFLIENQNKEGIVTLEEGKLQYQVVKKGSGQGVETYSKPLIRYSGKCLNGPSIPQSEEFVDLDETILGFQKALVGMKEGEVRTLYIHPEFGYGDQPHPMPNALLIFEVELIKADGSVEAHAASNGSSAEETIFKETFAQ